AARLHARGLHLRGHVVDRLLLARGRRAAAFEIVGRQRLHHLGKALRIECRRVGRRGGKGRRQRQRDRKRKQRGGKTCHGVPVETAGSAAADVSSAQTQTPSAGGAGEGACGLKGRAG